eukprot:COSAG01_NODE_1241_length_11085_cov_9.712361_15_plen_59_part_00
MEHLPKDLMLGLVAEDGRRLRVESEAMEAMWTNYLDKDFNHRSGGIRQDLEVRKDSEL